MTACRSPRRPVHTSSGPHGASFDTSRWGGDKLVAMSESTPPNHHAHFPSFGGWSGAKAAVGFLSGRDEAAALAIELTGLRAGQRVIDIGCGPGIAAVRAADAGAIVLGLDPAAVMLRVARLRWALRRDVRWRLGAAESLPVGDGAAHVVWSLATVHHWDDLDAGLREVARALVPGGRFLAMERRIEDPYAEGVASHGWTRAQAESFASMCDGHGFTNVAVSEHAITPEAIAVLATLPERGA